MERKQNKQNCTEAGIKVSADATVAIALHDDSTNTTYDDFNITKANTFEVETDLAIQAKHEMDNGLGFALGVNDLAEAGASTNGSDGANFNLVVTAPGARGARFYISTDGNGDAISKSGLRNLVNKNEDVKHSTNIEHAKDLTQIGATATQGAGDYIQSKHTNPTVGLMWDGQLGGQKTRFAVSASNSEGSGSAGAQATTIAVMRKMNDKMSLGASYTDATGLGMGNAATVYGDLKLANKLEVGGSFSVVEAKVKASGLGNHEVAVVSAKMPVGADDKYMLSGRYMVAEGKKSGAKNADELIDLAVSTHLDRNRDGSAKATVKYQRYEAKNSSGVELTDGKRETVYINGKYQNKLGFGNCPAPQKE